MLVLVFILAGIISPNAKIAEASISAVIGTVTGVISAGASVGIMTNSVTGSSYGVTCGIEVENWTRFTLFRARTYMADGVITVPATHILPARKEGMSVRTSGWPKGTWGTTSWSVGGQNRNIIVMWSVPWSHRHYRNTLAVGIVVGTLSDILYAHMYYGRLGGWFNRKEFGRSSSPVIYRDDLIEISGTMGTSHRAIAKIIIRPVNVTNLANSIKEAMHLN